MRRGRERRGGNGGDREEGNAVAGGVFQSGVEFADGDGTDGTRIRLWWCEWRERTFRSCFSIRLFQFNGFSGFIAERR